MMRLFGPVTRWSAVMGNSSANRFVDNKRRSAARMLSWIPICHCLAFHYEVSSRGPLPVRRYGEDMLPVLSDKGGADVMKSRRFDGSWRLSHSWLFYALAVEVDALQAARIATITERANVAA